MKSFNRIRRLNQVAGDVIEKYGFQKAIVADIATDHGYLAELLSRNESVSKVFATDISQRCLDKTNELKQRCKLDKIETRLGDGLEPIDYADLTVLAGIGGYEIIKILSQQNALKNGENKCNLFVFQPSKNAVELRLYLIDNNIKIVSDFIVFSSGRFYPIIIADLLQKNDTEKTLFNLHFGRDNSVNNVDFLRFLNRQIEDLKFLENMSNSAINSGYDLKTKFDILQLAKNLINKSKGD